MVFSILRALWFLITLVSTASTSTDVQETMNSLVSAFTTGSIEKDAKSYFSSHGEQLLEQVTMLDAMALAKLGKQKEAKEQLVSLSVQTLLGGLPDRYQIAGDMVRMFQTNKGFFRRTIAAVNERVTKLSEGLDQVLLGLEKDRKTKVREKFEAVKGKFIFNQSASLSVQIVGRRWEGVRNCHACRDK